MVIVFLLLAEKNQIEEERKQRKKTWHKERYNKQKAEYLKREYDRRQKIKEALKLLEEKQGIKLDDIKVN